MALRVYNTLTRKKEPFIPREAGKVSMYVCGVTPYNHSHLGNARPFVTWDVIRRFLEFQGMQITHIQNFTDVDDKIIHTANQEGVTWDVIARRYIDAYFDVMDQLNIKRADRYPKVSEHMPEIVAMVDTLIQKGYAYQVDGDVYFSVHAFPGYGKLSGRNLEDMQAGARVEVDDRKRHPMDFALWKSAKPGEPAWDSPWGPGRAGWHIECSAMSLKYLGHCFDFHGGGSDLIFPHHENEIAQSEACTGCAPFVRYWLHNGFITINEEKMSKSLGNFTLVKDILAHFAPEVLRFFILSTHYRSPLDFSDERLTEAGRSLERLLNAQQLVDDVLATNQSTMPSDAGQQLQDRASRVRQKFVEAMEDDFNTALAISTLFDLARDTNSYCNHVRQHGEAVDTQALTEISHTYHDLLGTILGLQKTQCRQDEQLLDGLMALLIEVRQKSRQAKDYATADYIRDCLGQLGIVLEDSPQGARWKRKE